MPVESDLLAPSVVHDGDGVAVGNSDNLAFPCTTDGWHSKYEQDHHEVFGYLLLVAHFH